MTALEIIHSMLDTVVKIEDSNQSLDDSMTGLHILEELMHMSDPEQLALIAGVSDGLMAIIDSHKDLKLAELRGE